MRRITKGVLWIIVTILYALVCYMAGELAGRDIDRDIRIEQRRYIEVENVRSTPSRF